MRGALVPEPQEVLRAVLLEAARQAGLRALLEAARQAGLLALSEAAVTGQRQLPPARKGA